MTAILRNKILPYLLSFLLIMATMPGGAMGQQQPAPASSPSSTYEGQGTPQTAQELQALVSPIALPGLVGGPDSQRRHLPRPDRSRQ